MSSEKPLQRLRDIVRNADAIASYTSGIDLEALERDCMRYDAVERCLERISEAAAKLGSDAFLLVPNQPWDQIRSFGNRLRHEYDRIQRDQLWLIVRRDLPSLRAACAEALKRFE